MKRNCIKNGRLLLAGLLSGSLLLGMTGCHQVETNALPETETICIEETEAQKKDTEKTVQKAGFNAYDKTETVYASADAQGNITKIEDEVILNYPGEGKRIMDKSNLKEIKNTEGDEAYEIDSKGRLVWENHGADIKYKGISEEKLPVNVKVTYFLNGKEVKPEVLAGQSGDIRIRFDYTNDTKVPFMTLLTLFLSDSFSNIEVTNGKLMQMDGENIVLGYAFPGLSDQLNLEKLEITEDIEIPEYVEISAYTEKFELDFTASIVTNGLFEDMEDDWLDDFDEMFEGIDKLQDASSEIVKGAGQFGDYLNQYTGAVSALCEGMEQYVDGIEAVYDKKDEIIKEAEALFEKIKDEDLAVSVMDEIQDAIQMLSQMDTDSILLMTQEKAREQAEAALTEALSDSGLPEEEKAVIIEKVVSAIDLSGQFEEIKNIIEPIRETLEAYEIDNSIDLETITEELTAFDEGIDALYEGAVTIGDSLETLESAGYDLADGYESLEEGISEFDREGIAKLSKLAGDDAKNLLEQLKTLRENDGKYDNFSGLLKGKTGNVRFIIETAEIK